MPSCRSTSETTIPSNCGAAAAVDHRPSRCSYGDAQDSAAAAAAMIDDYVMIAAAVDAAWNFSLSSSAPDRWSAVDPAVHCRRTALGPGRSAPPSRSHIPEALYERERGRERREKHVISAIEIRRSGFWLINCGSFCEQWREQRFYVAASWSTHTLFRKDYVSAGDQ